MKISNILISLFLISYILPAHLECSAQAKIVRFAPCIERSALTPNPAKQYQPQASAWTQSALEELNTHDIQTLLELTYASYMRSYMTLVTQRDYLKLFAHIGSGWNHILKTRLNPSKDNDFDVTEFTINNTLFTQITQFQALCTAQKKYVDLTETLVTHNSSASKIFVDDIRQRARGVVAQALTGIIEQITKEIETAHIALTQAVTLFKNDAQFQNFSHKSITDLLWYYVPELMVKAFVNFDTGYATGSSACFAAYINSQETGNKLWHTIELERAAFYAAHYQELYKGTETTSGFSTAGFVSPEEIIEQLIVYNATRY